MGRRANAQIVVFDDFAAQGLSPQDGAHAPAPRRGFEPIGSVLAPLCADALSACSAIESKTLPSRVYPHSGMVKGHI